MPWSLKPLSSSRRGPSQEQILLLKKGIEAENKYMAGEEDAAAREDGVLRGLSQTLFVLAAISFFNSKSLVTPPATKKRGGGSAARVNIDKFASAWRGNESLHLRVYLSDNNETYGEEALWVEEGLVPNFNKSNAREKTFLFDESHGLVSRAWKNQTVFAHVLLSDEKYSVVSTVELVRHLEIKKPPAKRSLLASKEQDNNESHGEQTTQQANSSTVVGHWKPTLRVRLVGLPSVISKSSVGASVNKHMKYDEDEAVFYPVLYVEEFWLMRSDYVPVNKTVDSLNLTVSFDNIGFIKWQMQQALEDHWEKQQSMGLSKDGETDMIREVLATTKPWLLAITAVVSALHMLFEVLTVRNNVKFWRNKKTLEGISARAIVVNCVVQLLVLLYLIDNDTSWMVILSNCLGLATECWKLTKAVRFVRRTEFPFVKVEVEESYAKSDTYEYDKIATSHLMFALIPLIIGFAMHSLVTSTHKSWYSFVVTTGVGFVYAFGFVNMTPQLYINYRLQSVAHLPWRAMTYKALNTFIDDLFAFIIKQPWLYRLACFRDDIIFIATLYQRWKYGVDKSRINEFGEAFDQDGGGGQDDAALLTTREQASKQQQLVESAKSSGKEL